MVQGGERWEVEGTNQIGLFSFLYKKRKTVNKTVKGILFIDPVNFFSFLHLSSGKRGHRDRDPLLPVVTEDLLERVQSPLGRDVLGSDRIG